MKDRIKNHLNSTLLAGILALVPVIVTFFVIGFLLRKIGGWLPKMIEAIFGNQFDNTILFGQTVQTILGLIITFLIIYLTGLIVSNIFGKPFVGATEKLMNKIPIVREVYVPVKQIMQTILNPSGSNRFKKAVVIRSPNSPFRVIGFVTGEVHEIGSSKPLATVFVPTSPNPTTGVMLFCDADVIHDINLRAETAMKMLISGGLIAPDNIVIGRELQRFLDVPIGLSDEDDDDDDDDDLMAFSADKKAKS